VISDATSLRWQSDSAEETESFGAQLAVVKPAADHAAVVVYLRGDLGAGKTTLARGFLRSCGVQGNARSPTYTLVESYEAGADMIVHLDLYRLRDPAELEALGVRDLARARHYWLVEWPERGTGRLPPADLVISLEVGPDSHPITTSAGTSVGERWLERLQWQA
jgi:tRNA threonylcarbamoyladenosine biosynthesis protein TsaE